MSRTNWLRKGSLFLTALFLAPLFSLGSLPSSEAGLEVSRLRSSDILFHRSIKNAIKILEKGIATGKKEEVVTALDRLKKIRLNLATEDLPQVVDYLDKRGWALIEKGQVGFALLILEKARESFPANARLSFSLGRLYLSKDNFDLQKGAGFIKEGVALHWDSSIHRGKWLGHIAALALVGVVLTAYLYMVTLIFRNRKKLTRDLAEKFCFPANSGVASFLVLLFLLIPLITGGIYLLALVTPVVLWGYFKNPKEKATVAIVVLVLLSLPGLSYLSEGSLKEEDLFYKNRIESFSQGKWDIESLVLFEKKLKNQPEDYFLNSSVGLIYGWIGEKNKALEAYKKLNKISPKNPDVLIGLGNSFFRLGNLKEAERTYEKALKLTPGGSVEAHYNLSLALEGLFKFKEAKEEYQKAANLDSTRLEDFLRNKSTKIGTPMDIVPLAEMEAPVTIGGALLSPFNKNLLRGLCVPTKGMKLYVSGGIFLFFLLLFPYLVKGKSSVVCAKCGTLFKEGEQCALCKALQTPEKLDPRKRNAAQMKLRKYQESVERKATLFNLLFPGVGMVMEEMGFPGFFSMLITATLITLIGHSLLVGAVLAWTVLLLIVLVLHFIIANLIFFKMR